jgi:hypothetical protein
MTERITRRAALTRSSKTIAAFALCPLGTACDADAGTVELADAGALPETDAGAFTLPRAVAGITIPDSALAVAAAELAYRASPPNLYNHVIRTYLFAGLLFGKLGKAYDAELVFVGSALHDLGLLDEYMSPTQRFELDGADAAMKFLTERGVAEARASVVWDAIALHTNGTIAARKAPEIAMVSAGAIMDAAGLNLDQVSPDSVAQVLDAYPRLGFKDAAIQTMLHLCEKKPLGQLLHPFAEVGRRHLPNFSCPTIEDLMLAAPFDE